ncbi:MAG TPA: DUF2804 family protein [Microthrixaceae bacterium]|nr:DUF2804 family protein [Microthrixaceae bacterium]
MTSPQVDRTREPSPEALVIDHKYQLGTYDRPIPTINPLDVVAESGFAGRAKRAARNFRLKEWEAFQLGNEDWFVLGAVYNAKSLGLLQVIAVHKQSGRIHRWQSQIPAPKLHVARGLDGTRSHGRSGDFSISLGNEVTRGFLTVDASHPGSASGGLPALELHGVGHCDTDNAAHLVICHPFAENKSLYSNKAMMPFAGTLRIGSEVIELDHSSSFMILDDHHGDYPSPMRYDWVTGARRRSDSTLEGFNLTANQITTPERFNENAVWIGNQAHLLPAVQFERPDGVHEAWRITDAAGGTDPSVDVHFTPTVRSELHVGPRRLLAEYYAPYGWFRGRIRYRSDGYESESTLEVDGMFGVGEQKLIRV